MRGLVVSINRKTPWAIGVREYYLYASDLCICQYRNGVRNLTGGGVLYR